MKTNDVACFYECDDVFMGATSTVSIAYLGRLNCMSIAVDIMVGDDRHTVYIPHSAVPQILQALSSSYYSIADTVQPLEEEDGK